MSNKMTFQQRCYEKLMQIPEGKVTTYGEIARSLGINAPRAVGTAMAKNSQLIKVPCHRVVRSDGNVGQYANGSDAKIALLQKEGITVAEGRVVNFEQVFFQFG